VGQPFLFPRKKKKARRGPVLLQGKRPQREKGGGRGCSCARDKKKTAWSDKRHERPSHPARANKKRRKEERGDTLLQVNERVFNPLAKRRKKGMLTPSALRRVYSPLRVHSEVFLGRGWKCNSSREKGVYLLFSKEGK